MPGTDAQLKLLVLTRYDRKGASSRLRTMQYRPYLEQVNFDVEYAPFFDDQYLERLYAGQSTKFSTLKYFWRRAAQIMRRPKPDLIWIEKEAFPWWPALLERAFLHKYAPVVSDHDDAVFHRFDRHKKWLVRKALGRKIDCVMARSQLVTAGNAYLAARARAAGATSVAIVPTVVDINRYAPKTTRPENREQLVIGWIGSPTTWEQQASLHSNVFDCFLRQTNAQVHVIGASKAEEYPGFRYLQWSEDTEADLIGKLDVGIMPLADDLWSRGKCGYKIIQYMACGLPVVASPVGVNTQIVDHGVTGLLAETPAEWLHALNTLAKNAALRARMGAAGRRKVEADYSLQVQGPRVARLLREVAEQRVGGITNLGSELCTY